MIIKELYDEAIKARKSMGIVGGDITLLMNTIIMLKIHNKLDELKPVVSIPEVISETMITSDKPKKKV